VLFNQVMVGSVNASRDHFQMAVDDLARACLLWSGHVGPESEQDIKVVVEWEKS